jgi:hypothetical protein
MTLSKKPSLKGPDSNSPLVWKSFVNDHSLMQFLEERVQQESVFKEQLLNYIEYSKADKRWRKVAANATTVLIRAGSQFAGADLQAFGSQELISAIVSSIRHCCKLQIPERPTFEVSGFGRRT